MNAQELYEDIFQNLKSHPTLLDVDVLIESPNNVIRGCICVDLVRDSLAGLYEFQNSFVGIELSINCFASKKSQISGRNNFEERVLQVLNVYHQPRINHHIVKRGFPVLLSTIGLYNSCQIHRFYFNYD